MLHIVHNPKSGEGDLRTKVLCRLLDRENLPYLLHSTTSPEELAKEYPLWNLGPADRVLVIGGDGSLSQLASLLPEENAPAVLLLPSGSGNDFARGMHMRRSEEAALRLIRSQALRPCPLDMGEVFPKGKEGKDGPAGRRFVVSCGIGYDAGVCLDIDQNPLKRFLNRLHLGKLAYLLLGIRGIFQYKKASGTLTLDQTRELSFRNLAFLSCHNLPYEGGGFAFAPGADPRDGELTVCLITARNRLTFTLTLLTSLLKLHRYLPNVHQYSCRELAVTTDAPLPFHADGDAVEAVTGFTARVLLHRLPFLFEPGKD